MKKRIAKKVLTNSRRIYSKQQILAAYIATLTSANMHGLVAGKQSTYHINDILNIEGINPPYAHNNGQYTITSIDDNSFTFSFPKKYRIE